MYRYAARIKHLHACPTSDHLHLHSRSNGHDDR
jgi:hypothetical protein